MISLEPNSLAGVWTGIRRIASACGAVEQREQLIANMRHRMESIGPAAPAVRPRVACIEWMEPLMPACNLFTHPASTPRP